MELLGCIDYIQHVEGAEYIRYRECMVYVGYTKQECTEHSKHADMKTIEIIECMERTGYIQYKAYGKYKV